VDTGIANVTLCSVFYFSTLMSMNRSAASAGISVPKQFLDHLKASDLYRRMKNIFEVAVSISPLLVLTKTNYKNVEIRRDHFIAVRVISSYL
jgi:hypothetical protein